MYIIEKQLKIILFSLFKKMQLFWLSQEKHRRTIGDRFYKTFFCNLTLVCYIALIYKITKNV